MKNNSNSWDEYYARTLNLPGPEHTARFLANIPSAGHILDFGAGSGRWSAAFLRDRPDLTIDALDQNIDQAALLPENWHGEKIKSSFQNFMPAKTYDGIWAFAALFFLEKRDLNNCFHKLASGLKENGFISFTMVDDCHAASTEKFHGLSKYGILEMLGREGLELTSLEFHADIKYSLITIPTYFVTAKNTITA